MASQPFPDDAHPDISHTDLSSNQHENGHAPLTYQRRLKSAETAQLLAIFAAIVLGVLMSVPAYGVSANKEENPEHTPTQFTPAPTSTSAPGCDFFWRVMSGGAVPDGQLSDLVALSASDIWTVGSYFGGSQRQTLTMHWDGSVWAVVPSPNPGYHHSLNAVSAFSTNDIWAVGNYLNGSQWQTFTMHWDGSAWKHIPSPAPDPSYSYLSDVVAISPTDAWAVGSTGTNPSYNLMMHWDGTLWTVIESPSPGTLSNSLQAVDATSSNDVWTVGGYFSGTPLPFALHWDGTSWTQVLTPNPDVYGSLTDIVALTPADAWIVGTSSSSTLTAHWDGTHWLAIPNPASNVVITGVSAVSSEDVWAAGYSYDSTYQLTYARTVHWDGTQWTLIPAANPGGARNDLQGIGAVDSNTVFAVGHYSQLPSMPTYPLMEAYSDPCAQLTPTSTIIPTFTSTLTSTVSPISTVTSTSTFTATASATTTSTSTWPPSPTTSPTVLLSPSPCLIAFTDVPQDHTFYPFVRCMACHGIINGYATGCETGNPCFRPGNLVTRGQLAKIVANAAGFFEPATGQQYEDVPEGSTFYDFIWRLTDRGIVNGYPCGGVGEPCGDPALPYFRPNNNVTRGQLAKIVANGAGLSDPVTGQQYEDIVEGSTFYEFIGRLTALGVINGYSCGGVGEPCGDPVRPYFRPGANATRGQASKIAANTFFPDCDPP